MKGSSSAPPETPNSQLRNSQVGRWFVGHWAFVIAAAYLAAHLPFLAPSLEDVDSVNFALGLRDFDPALHQPHPPGHPLYIALGRVSLFAVSTLRPGLSAIQAEALALALWSALGASLAIVAAMYLFAALRPTPVAGGRPAIWAVMLLTVSPLFWMSGLRPLSDAIGLAAVLAAQGLVLRGMVDRRWLIAAAFAAGVAAGIRVQALALTLPLLCLAMVAQRRAGLTWLLSRPAAAFVAGCLLWMVPLVAASGGLDAYLGALGNQANEDFSWANMLWVERTPRRLAFALYETFVLPWSWVPLAVAVAIAALVGIAVTMLREGRALFLVATAFVPYTVFHLLFQDTFEVRYALPILPAIAWLAARGIAETGRLAPLLAGPLAIAALVIAIPASITYGREAHPAFRLIGDASARAVAGVPAAVFSHHELWRALQADSGGLPVVAPRRQYEWLGMVEYWRGGGTAPVWFIADPRRTDLDLIDPQIRGDVTRYRWSLESRPELAGTRPRAADWYRFTSPGWFAGEGWSLTPETGGLAQATNMGPGHRPIEAWVRRRPEPMHLVIGGRHLGEPSEPDAEFELAIDGTVRDRWTLTPGERNFLRFVDLPDGLAGTGVYAHLTVRAASTGSAAPPNVAIRQFDVQSARELISGFGEGWHEAEFDLPTGGRWRWTSERSVLRVKGPPGALRITLRGESPLRYFDAPPTVRVTAAGRVVAELQPRDDFEWTITVPADDVSLSNGAIVIETDRVYLPGEVEGTADERRLGLRLWESVVHPALP